MTESRTDGPPRTDGPMPTRDAWLRAVRGVVLKSNPDGDDAAFAEAFTRQLVSETEDGVEIQPLYDASEPIEVGLPGFAPYVRSTHAAPSPWEIRQRAWPAVDGSSARGELESGATGVLVELPADADAALVAHALDGVFLELAPVSLATPADDVGLTAARALADRWNAVGIAADDRRGTLGVDAVGTWLRTGGATDLDSALADAAALVGELTGSAPHARVVVADGTVWHDAGATDAQEIAWNVAAAAHTVRALVAAGIPLDRASRQLEFRWAATADQFETIATFRAARQVWARVGEIAGLPPTDRTSFHHADCSRVMMTRYDPWVNALRSTVACFAAGMGGADAVTVLPHDAFVTTNQVDGAGTALGRRIARNTQTVLQLESNLARVVDPAGGSWYVEYLTNELAAKAWSELQRIEAAGGIVAAVEAGLVHESLDEARTARERRVATRRQPLTGLSEFPDIAEPPPPPPPPPRPATIVGDGPGRFEPLALHRASERFERQRGRADRAAGADARPAVFLATLGTLAQSTARATFAKNLFETAGIVTVAGPVDEFAASGTSIACLCSSDQVYADAGEPAAAALRAAGAEYVFVAGRKLGLTGVDEEIGVGSDVLDVVTRTLDLLGVEPDPADVDARGAGVTEPAQGAMVS